MRAAAEQFGLVSFRDCSEAGRAGLLEGAREVSEAICSGLDYGEEILLNARHGFGDTVCLVRRGQVTGFAICHLEPYGEFEERRELKVAVLALRPTTDGGAGEPAGPSRPAELGGLYALLVGVCSLAAREGLSSVRLHVKGDKCEALRVLLSWGCTVAYSDLRMCVAGFEEREPRSYLHFSRWQ